VRILRGFFGLFLLIAIVRWFRTPSRNDIGGN